MLTSSLCWKLHFGNQVGYLFGSFHIKSAQTYALTLNVIPLLECCDLLCLEVDLDRAHADLQIYPLKTLRSIIPSYLADRWRPRFKRYYSLDIDLFFDLPAYLFYQAVTSRCFDSTSPVMVDEQLWDKAKSMDLPVRGLESIESQLDLLKLMEQNELLKMIGPAVKTVSKFRKNVQRLLNIYLQQDIRRLYLMGKSQAGTMRNSLIYRRNRTMTDQILEVFVAGHQPFVAVGAGHLAGEQGVLRLLKRAGFKIQPVDITKL